MRAIVEAWDKSSGIIWASIFSWWLWLWLILKVTCRSVTPYPLIGLINCVTMHGHMVKWSIKNHKCKKKIVWLDCLPPRKVYEVNKFYFILLYWENTTVEDAIQSQIANVLRSAKSNPQAEVQPFHVTQEKQRWWPPAGLDPQAEIPIPRAAGELS